jgi:hypothetical protein
MAESRIALRFHAAFGLDWMQRLAGWSGDLTGWRRYGIGFFLGVLAAAALPPVDIVPTLIVSFSGLIWLADGCHRPREFFALGWSFAFGFFLAGLYWIAISLFTDIASFWWLLPFAVLALPAALAILGGLALFAYHWIGRLRHRHLRPEPSDRSHRCAAVEPRRDRARRGAPLAAPCAGRRGAGARRAAGRRRRGAPQGR